MTAALFGRCPVCAPLRDQGKQCACPPRASYNEPIHRDQIVRVDAFAAGLYVTKHRFVVCDCGEAWRITTHVLRSIETLPTVLS